MSKKGGLVLFFSKVFILQWYQDIIQALYLYGPKTILIKSIKVKNTIFPEKSSRIWIQDLLVQNRLWQ